MMMNVPDLIMAVHTTETTLLDHMTAPVMMVLNLQVINVHALVWFCTYQCSEGQRMQ